MRLSVSVCLCAGAMCVRVCVSVCLHVCLCAGAMCICLFACLFVCASVCLRARVLLRASSLCSISRPGGFQPHEIPQGQICVAFPQIH